MEFLDAVGSRRSIRWFRPWADVEPRAVQRILEAARMCGCPGNLQPWRAVVVRPGGIDADARARLIEAAHGQRQMEQAPVWIYWFGDATAAAPHAFLAQVTLGIEIGMLSREAGWDPDAARAAIEEGRPTPSGMPALHETVHGLPPQVAAVLASQETVGAITVATLAAVDEGLGTCLMIPASPTTAPVLYELLGVPEHFVPVWLQLVGHPAEDPRAGGQRPRERFEDLYADGRWGTPLARDPEVVAELERERLLQEPAPLPGRDEELAHLARMFGYGPAERRL
jgi:nitroreductase